MSRFNKFVQKIVNLEGGYVNHPADRGGPTKYGITEKVARRHGYKGDMRELSRAVAIAIYKKDYYEAPRFSQLKDDKLSFEVVDMGVNAGTRTAGILLQKAYNLLPTKNKLVEDGIVGPATLRAINNFSQPQRLLMVFAGLRVKYYLDIVESNQSQEVFLYGWLSHRTSLEV